VLDHASKDVGRAQDRRAGRGDQHLVRDQPELAGKGGVYCEDVDISQAVPADHPDPVGVRPWARDPALAEHCGAQRAVDGAALPR